MGPFMPTLFFPERETLRRALASGGVAPAVAQAPASAGLDGQGRLWLTTESWLPKETLVALTKFGVQILGSSIAGAAEAVSCWHELVALEPVVCSPDQFTGPVLFELPGRRFASFASEIERLGAQPYSCRWSRELVDDVEDDRVLVRTSAPPFATLLCALDAGTDIAAYVEQSPRTWVAAGWRHPLAGLHQPPPGKLLFLRPPRRWEWRDELPFTEPYSPRLAGGAEDVTTTPPASRGPYDQKPAIPVALRLVPDGIVGPAELWVIRDSALSWLSRFISATDERTLSRFVAAVTRADGRPCVVLRVRGGKEPPPVLVGMSAGYAPLLKLANLFAPVGRRIAPAPRRDTLRRLLAPDAKRLTWLRQLPEGAFRAESIPLTAFRPLLECVEYRVEREHGEHQPWQQTAALGLERFRVAAESLPRPKPAAAKPRDPKPAKRPKSAEQKPARGRKRGMFGRAIDWLVGSKETADNISPGGPQPDEAAPIPVEDAKQTSARLPPDRSMAPAKAGEARKRVKTLTSQFLGSLTRLTPADRLALWPDLAEAFAHANNPSEAALCWLNGLWEQERLSPAWAWGWLKAEAAQAGWNPHTVRLAEWLGAPSTSAGARAVAAYVVWAALQSHRPTDFLANLSGLQAYLDTHEKSLPLRSVWLARTALARMARGDVLAQARVRDRLFERLLEKGLDLGLDVPNFIRFGESTDADRVDLVRKWLMDRRGPMQKWITQLGPERVGGEPDRLALEPYGLQAEVRCTRAYADLMLAWGLARLGDKIDVDRLRDQAWQVLDGADPIHDVLKSGFDQRIRQACAGKLAGGPLTADLLARIEALPTDHRYRIDRLRQHSRILDPTERINAYWASTLRPYRGWDELRKKLVELPGLEPAALNERVRGLLAKASGEGAAALPAVLLEVLDVAPRLEPGLGEKVLDQVHSALDLAAGTSSLQLRLLEKGLRAAAYFDRPTTVQRLAHRFALFVEEQRGLPASTMLEGLTGQTFRCLRRLGLKNEADRVLFQVAGWLTRGEDIPRLRQLRAAEWPSLMRTLLHVAAGWYYCGRDKEGHAIIDEVRRDLFDGAMSLPERTALALTYATTLGQVPVRLALGRFEELFQRLKRVTVNGWNSHYTLQPLELIDTVVLAVVSEDFTLGPEVRGWMDDDEYLVRQRIHQELKVLMEEQGV